MLVQSFIDAYHGRSSDGYQAKEFSPFAMIPLPNWRVDYNGFAELPLIKQYFSSFTLNHAYSSIYSIGSYTTNNIYSAEPSFGSPGSPPVTPFQQNTSHQYQPYYVVGQVSIVETLAPLIGVNFQTVSKPPAASNTAPTAPWP